MLCQRCGCKVGPKETKCDWCREWEQERSQIVSEAADPLDYHIPEIFKKAKWNTLDKPLAQQMSPVLKGDMPSLVLAGPVGTGKSWAMWGLIDAFARLKQRVQFITWENLSDLARDCRLYGSVGEESVSLMRKLRVSRYLAIDDFACTKPYEAEFTQIRGLISTRYNECRTTIITTNSTEQEISERLDAGIFSRMKQGLWIEVQGKDRRRNGK